MYFAVRIVFSLILLFVVILILWKRKRSALRKKTVMALILVTMGLGVLLQFCPIENVLVGFDSPESVFHYMRVGEIQSLIEGENSTLVVYSQGRNASSVQIIEKAEGAYRIPVFSMMKRIDSDTLDTTAGHYEVLRFSDTEDYYICVSVMMTAPIDSISDSFSTNVRYTVSELVGSKTSVVSIYAYSKGYPDRYYLNINGNRILALE